MILQTGADKAAYYEAWAKMMVTIWEEKVMIMNIRDTGDLLRSFQYQVIASAGGDIGKIVFTYMYYGRMVDMGVRRGVKQGQQNTRRKPWYNKPWYHSVKLLTEKTAALYGEEFKIMMHETMNSSAMSF